jgi:molecular chaperone DnaJ
MQLSLRGKGNAGRHGGPAGDLIIQIEEADHEHFQRENDNIIHDLYISLPDAALGTTVDVPTLDGKARFKIEPGTQSGKVVRLRGKGLPSVNGGSKRGDQLVHINVWTPQVLSAEEKKILEKLRASQNFSPAPTAADRSFMDRIRDIFN